MSTGRKRDLKAGLALGLLGSVLLAVLLFSLLLFHDHTLVGGWAVDRDETVLDCRDLPLHSTMGLRRLRDPQQLDLRGSHLRLKPMQRLRERFPDCAIRWDVPIGGARYDRAALAV